MLYTVNLMKYLMYGPIESFLTQYFELYWKQS